MNSFSDLQAIDPKLLIVMDLCSVIHNGVPHVAIEIGSQKVFSQGLEGAATFTHEMSALEPFVLAVTMSHKQHHVSQETAVMINKITVDGIDLLPDHVGHFQYHDDHGNQQVTTYLGWNGTWRLHSDRPFYQWLHQARGQGWLLDFTA